MQRRKLMLLIRCTLVICLSNFLTISIYAQANDSTATVYFIRTIGARSAWGALNIFVDNDFQCKINDNRYFKRTFPPGEHFFSIQAQGKKYKKRIERIPLQLEAGKTYYMQVTIMYATFLNYLYLQEVTQNTANLVLPKLSEDKSCAVNEN